jgi:hypothetical protein
VLATVAAPEAASGPAAAGEPVVTVGSAVLVVLWACGSACPWISATS